MIIRVLLGAGLLALGYYVGREVGRAEPIRKQLDEARTEGDQVDAMEEDRDSELTGDVLKADQS